MDQNSQTSQGSDGESGSNAFKEALLEHSKNAITAMTQVYTMANQGYAYGYAQGRQAAYEDVFKWFTNQHDNTLRYVSAKSFFNYIDHRLSEVKSKYAKGKFQINSNNLGGSNDESMSDGISRLERLASDADSTSVEMRSNTDNNSSSLINNLGLREGAMMIQENRKRRRNPFNFGSSQPGTENCINSELPRSLRPENNVDDKPSNPFLVHDYKEDPRIEIPKRRKLHW